jgi:hypothetical protein
MGLEPIFLILQNSALPVMLLSKKRFFLILVEYITYVYLNIFFFVQNLLNKNSENIQK